MYTMKMIIRLFVIVLLASWEPTAHAHIIPPENFHPVAESYRRMNFVLSLNPVEWEMIKQDSKTIADYYESTGIEQRSNYRHKINELINQATLGEEPLEHTNRIKITHEIFERSTKAVAHMITGHLTQAENLLTNYASSSSHLQEARQMWASFEHEIKNSDPDGFIELGQSWLELSSALGNPGIMGMGRIQPEKGKFEKRASKLMAYLNANYGDSFKTPEAGLYPLPVQSRTFKADKTVPIKLPPGNNINKQIPRPRQILNMAARGVDESETALIALGDMAFDSAHIFGKPAQALSITCNTCHNKSITNPQFFIPGLSKRSGGMDVSNSFFAPHANNGVFDPLDIPDLRGIRFTAPYGRNGRIASLREFIRNVIMHEFNGPEPDPLILDSMIAYMNEFDFLPNPQLNADGSLNDSASESAKRGEKIFHTPFKQMNNMSCATCHIPSNNFIDRKSHDIGTVKGVEPYSRDRSMDTPTLLGIKYTAPYFHDGSQPTIKDVVEWFNQSYKLGLKQKELQDLTAYVDTVGDGTDAYEDTPYYLDAELEEFSFFLSTYEYLKEINKTELMNITFSTISLEIKNHKWELQDRAYMPIMERLAEIMDEAVQANLRGDTENVDFKVAEYRKLYTDNKDYLK